MADEYENVEYEDVEYEDIKYEDIKYEDIKYEEYEDVADGFDGFNANGPRISDATMKTMHSLMLNLHAPLQPRKQPHRPPLPPPLSPLTLPRIRSSVMHPCSFPRPLHNPDLPCRIRGSLMPSLRTAWSSSDGYVKTQKTYMCRKTGKAP